MRATARLSVLAGVRMIDEILAAAELAAQS